MLTTAITVNIGMISLAESEVTKRLAAWGALITVPTLIAGIYGMNFENMPELQWEYGYPYRAGADGWRSTSCCCSGAFDEDQAGSSARTAPHPVRGVQRTRCVRPGVGGDAARPE